MKKFIIYSLRWFGVVVWPFLCSLIVFGVSVFMNDVFVAFLGRFQIYDTAFWVAAAVQDVFLTLLWVGGTYFIVPVYKWRATAVSFAFGALLASYITFIVVPSHAAPHFVARYAPYILSLATGGFLLIFFRKRERETRG